MPYRSVLFLINNKPTQDASLATESVVTGHSGGVVVLLGDPNQRLDRVACPLNMAGAQTFALTHSFRFGPDVCSLCNSLVDDLMFAAGPYLGESPTFTDAFPLPR